MEKGSGVFWVFDDPCTEDNCSGGVCDNPPKCTWECCEGECCDEGVPCVEGQCCESGVVCGGQCCPSGGIMGAIAQAPVCCNEACCLPGLECCGECCEPQNCCGDNCCAPGQDCCADGSYCSETCDECIDYGDLSGGTVDVTPDPVCLGDTLTFTVSGVVDSGGQMRENCVLVNIPPGTIEYTWEITKPDTTMVTCSGTSADVVADQAGGYSCTFTASVNRDCAPDDLTLDGTANAIGPDLILAGLPDADEVDPGGVLCFNAEPPFPALTMKIPGATTGAGRFEVVSGDQLIQMYEDASGTQPVAFFNQTWNVSEFPITRYIAGVTRSVTPRDVELKLTYTGDQGTCEDVVKLTVVSVDLLIHNGGSDLDHGDDDPGCHQGSAVSEDDEETVGAYVLVNWDDDDGDGSMNADGTWESDPVPDLTLTETFVRHEDNLAKLLPTLDPVPGVGTVELEIVGGAGKVTLWSTCWKETELQAGSAVKTWDLSDAAQRTEFLQFGLDGIWLEGIAASDAERDVELELRYVNPNGQTCFDTVNATVVMINLGNAVHREGTLIGVAERGHAALVWKFLGPLTRENLHNDDKFLVIHMAGPTDTDPLTVMTQSPGETTWGCFTNPQITLVERLKILKTAKTLVAWAGNITWIPESALEPVDWDGRLDTVRFLRCDGLVELCYEINGVEVWAMVGRPPEGGPHYDITDMTDLSSYDAVWGTWTQGSNGLPDNLEEHNDFDAGWYDWEDTLMPATQCGHKPPIASETRFEPRDLCSPCGTKGGNP